MARGLPCENSVAGYDCKLHLTTSIQYAKDERGIHCGDVLSSITPTITKLQPSSIS